MSHYQNFKISSHIFGHAQLKGAGIEIVVVRRQPEIKTVGTRRLFSVNCVVSKERKTEIVISWEWDNFHQHFCGYLHIFDHEKNSEFEKCWSIQKPETEMATAKPEVIHKWYTISSKFQRVPR
jgi:hypothetical protein